MSTYLDVKNLIALLLALIFVACSPERVENPAAQAETFSSNEYVQDQIDLETGYSRLKLDLSPVLESHQGPSDRTQYQVDRRAMQKFFEKSENKERMREIKSTVEKCITSIESFLTKYDGYFRIRYSDGDLKLMKLKSEVVEDLQDRREFLLQTLKNIEIFAINVPIKL